MDHNIVEVLVPVGVLGTLGTVLVMFTRTLTDYYLRKKMIEKGLTGVDASELLKHQKDSRFTSLKWGLILLFGGFGLMILELIPTRPHSALPFGILATSIALGFLIYYFRIKKETEKEG